MIYIYKNNEIEKLWDGKLQNGLLILAQYGADLFYVGEYREMTEYSKNFLKEYFQEEFFLIRKGKIPIVVNKDCTKLVACTERQLNYLKLFIKNFKFKVENGNILIFLHDKWYSFQGFNRKPFYRIKLFDKVSAVIKKNGFFIEINGELIEEGIMSLDFWKGDLPKEIFCDYIKEKIL